MSVENVGCNNFYKIFENAVTYLWNGMTKSYRS